MKARSQQDQSELEQIDEKGLKRYKALFKDGIGAENREKLLNSLFSFYGGCEVTSKSRELRVIVKDLTNLIDLSVSYSNICYEDNFRKYDNLLRKYAHDDYSDSILEYVNYHRKRFWFKSKIQFSDGQRAGAGFNLACNDEVEVFSMVDFTTNYNKQIDEPWYLSEMGTIELGLSDYVHEKLGKEANNVNKIKNLFETIINPVCRSVTYRFAKNDVLAEVVKNREDLREDLDEISFKLLTAINLCKIEKHHKESVENKVISLLSKERENKKSSCLGKFFNKQTHNEQNLRLDLCKKGLCN